MLVNACYSVFDTFYNKNNMGNPMTRRISFLMSVIALSTCCAIASSTPSADYCTKEVLESTPAARNNSCTLRDFHKTDKGDCFVMYQNCKAKVFNPKENQVVDFTIPSVNGTFPNHENIKELKMRLIYNVNVILAMAKPQQQNQPESPSSTTTAIVKDGK